MFFKKKEQFSEVEIALEEMIAARDELTRVETLFNYVNDDYFAIANTELTIAKLKYDVAFKKLKMLCANGIAVPQMQIYKSYETV